MVEPASFEELDQAIGNVLDAETTNFFELAEMLGLDPKQDFAGADLSGTDFFRGDLAGANFGETDLRGADLAYANLQGANLTNAQLGISPSSYLGRAQEIYRMIVASDNARARDLARALVSDLVSDRARARALTLTLTLALALARVLARALACVLALALARVLALDLDLDDSTLDDSALDALYLDAIVFDASNRASALASALDLNARDLASDLDASDLARDLASNLVLARIRVLNLARARVHTKYNRLIYVIGGGANLTGANLTGVKFDGADVEGAIMTGCTGLSESEIADLKRRGAIFDDALGDRSEARVPAPR